MRSARRSAGSVRRGGKKDVSEIVMGTAAYSLLG